MIPESQRLAELAAYGVLDTAAEPAFDDIVRVAAEAAGCPTALISLLDEDRQWFKARHGMDAGQTPRDQAFCENALRADAPLVVPDATADARFADNPLVTGALGIRFYAGFPLRTATGAVLGTLCVLGYELRPGGLTGAQERLLTVLAAQVLTQLELRRTLAQQAEALGGLDVALSSYRALADHATDVISRHAPDGTTLYASPSMRHVLGYDPEQEVGRSAPERVHADDAADMFRALGEVLGGAPSTASVRSRHADGTWRHLEIRLSPVCDRSGAVVQVHSVARDVTDRHDVQERLRLSEEGFRLAFAEAPIGIALVAPDGRWLRVNQVLCDIVGHPSDRLLSLTFQDITHPDDLAADEEQVRQMLAGEIVTYQMDKRYQHSRGNVVWVQLNVSLVRDDQGEPLYFVSHIQDITGRKATEAQLRDSEERFRRLASTAPIGIFQTDAVGRCTYANPTWAAICGVKVDVVPGREWTSVVHPEDIGVTREAWSQALEDPVPFLHRFRAQLGDGEACWVDVRLIPLPRENGRPPGWVGTATDVTPVIEANVAIAEARDRALQASQLKSQFLANMSHEIRTPMNGVVGTAELLADSPLSDSQRAHVDALRAAASSLMAVLNDVLDFSKIEAGKLALDPATFHLPTLISDTVALFAATAQTKGIDLAAHLAPMREWLWGDATRIRQVLANLLGNAVKFTERGEVALIVEESAAHGSVRFSVVDSGIGIPDAVGARLMRPFEQGDPSTTRRFGGSGLGLAICHELVGLMGGNISFTSIPGAGTTFTVELPLPSAEPADVMNPASIGGVWSSPDAAGHVLVAEDIPINQLVARGMLERLGWNVDVVGDGQAAVEAAARGAYDVVILDCQMPVLDGYEAARAIRLLPGRSGRSPIIAMTANALAEDRQRCLDAGMDDYIAKPITTDGLAEVLHRATHAPARLG